MSEKDERCMIMNRSIDNGWRLQLMFDPDLSINGVVKTGAMIWEMAHNGKGTTIPVSDQTALALILHKKGKG